MSLLLPWVPDVAVYLLIQPAHQIGHDVDSTSSGLNILVVEDEPILCEIMPLVLIKSGFNPIIANSFKQVKDAQLQSKYFNLVICDVILQDAMAPAILELFRQAGNDSKFVFISGNFSAEVVEFIGGSDSIATLDKPFKIGDFISFVSREVQQLNIDSRH